MYYAWEACNLDDTFAFSKDKCIIDDKGTVCENGLGFIFDFKGQSYSYDADKKWLTIGSGEDVVVLNVYELNEHRMKLGLPIFGGNIVLLFKKK